VGGLFPHYLQNNMVTHRIRTLTGSDKHCLNLRRRQMLFSEKLVNPGIHFGRSNYHMLLGSHLDFHLV